MHVVSLTFEPQFYFLPGWKSSTGHFVFLKQNRQELHTDRLIKNTDKASAFHLTINMAAATQNAYELERELRIANNKRKMQVNKHNDHDSVPDCHN
jgi:hypothetical protein